MVQAPRTVDVAADALRERILAGEFAPGDRLPAERRLSEELGISRLTLRAAIARLQTEGLVQPRQGDGVRVLEYQRSAGVELLPHLLEHGRIELLAPFLQLRRALASEAVAEACRRASDADLDALDALAAELSTAHGVALREGNLEFSRRVVELAGNLPMLLLFNTVTRVYRSRADVAEAMLVDRDAVRASFPAIVELIRRRDPAFARDTVRTVLEALDAATIATLEAP
ncbi:MAG: FadR family transcriptional regulator [Alphaproteobacteria bacterium]|nr:FadR family transcriptional regulator [Alphaproteobacteria bacterium]